MKKNFITIALILTVSFTAIGQVDKEYSKSLKKMFEVSGAEESYQVAIQQIFAMYREEYSNVGSDIWEDLEKEFSNTSLDKLTEMLVPVYSKYLTLEDLQELIEFYETPIGKKLVYSTPLILKESMQIGKQWGIKIGEDFEKKMKEKGY